MFSWIESHFIVLLSKLFGVCVCVCWCVFMCRRIEKHRSLSVFIFSTWQHSTKNQCFFFTAVDCLPIQQRLVLLFLLVFQRCVFFFYSIFSPSIKHIRIAVDCSLISTSNVIFKYIKRFCVFYFLLSKLKIISHYQIKCREGIEFTGMEMNFRLLAT